MKNIIFALCACVVSVCFGQPEVMPPLICSGVTTSTVAITATSQKLSAYIKGCEIAVDPAGSTCVVSIATSGALASRTIYSGSCIGTKMLNEVVQFNTNETLVAGFDYPFLASEALVVSASTAGVSNDVLTVTVKPIIDRTR